MVCLIYLLLLASIIELIMNPGPMPKKCTCTQSQKIKDSKKTELFVNETVHTVSNPDHLAHAVMHMQSCTCSHAHAVMRFNIDILACIFDTASWDLYTSLAVF